MSYRSRLTRRNLLATLGGATAVTTAGCGVLDSDEEGGENGEDGGDGNGEQSTNSDLQIQVQTRPPTTVGSRSVILRGRLTDLGAYGTVDCSFQYRQSGGEWNRTPTQSLSAPEEFSEELSGLSPATDYEIRAVAEADGRSKTAEFESFTTRPDPGTAQVTADDLMLFFEGSGDDRTAIAEAAVENDGGDASGRITLEITWYNDDRTALTTSTETLETLLPEETWLVQVTDQGVDDDVVASVTAETTVEDEPPARPDRVEVAQSRLDAAEYPIEITGAVENTGEDAISTVPIGRAFDDEGNVVADSRASTLDVPPGEQRRFVAGFFRRAAERIDNGFDHDVLLDHPGR